MHTASLGNATEAAVLRAFVDRDLQVLVPFGGGHPVDLVVSLGPTIFLRVQCKTARRRKGCLPFNSRTTDHGKGRLPYDGLADVFGVYSPTTDRVYLVPVAEATTFCFSLRLEPTLNNQRLRVRWAADYEIDQWTTPALQALVRGEHPDRLSLAA
jgi:hypothetical protein